ncbi:RND family efflux transporter MFP subunit [Rhodanobacter sp. ANJX3]|uniref:efflux RND transporter periplasmic adaptor subunit n=1 Tax=unclassified Rhodanobacter TaxID=2621553 RepID=UPI0018395309|nr:MULTISPECIES: efflux RND transporter periplasmic adaptor subunit [unclassified Rhodanobacter]MBB5359808.1 RND family efflux transporter MFP subunit [Rhodanobacter sp. ANJX3]NYE28722.1 RND family efflux transporter MFP subunit [Rhodanobacter sp. K2T2]
MSDTSRSESNSTFPTPKPPSRRGVRIAGVIALVVIVVVVILGLATRVFEAKHLKTWTDEQNVPTVNVAAPEQKGAGAPLQLPGRIEAYTQAPMYARTGGYLKSWKVDIGGKVKAGQLLAEIETPDLDQQLLQAKADLASAQANESLAATTAKRWQAMLASDSVAKQEVDEKTGDYTAKRALANAAKANVDRIEATKGYARIVAPFDGVVTARNTDVGALINEGSSGGGQPLFVVSDVSKLRVYVQVPQAFVPSIPAGATAQLTVPEYPGRTFTAKVDASAQAVNASSGSTLLQLSVDNADGKLMPGSFTNVQFKLDANAAGLRVPASALIFNASGLHLATVGSDNKVTFKTVTIQHDYGKTVEIGSGISANDRVIDSPPDGLVDGDQVKIAQPQAKDKPDAKA